jgi:hypothetical protein
MYYMYHRHTRYSIGQGVRKWTVTFYNTLLADEAYCLSPTYINGILRSRAAYVLDRKSIPAGIELDRQAE